MNILQLFIQAENVKYPSPTTSSSSSSKVTKKNAASSYAIVYNIHGLGNVMGIQKIEIGRTDIVWACCDPEYVGPILVRHDDSPPPPSSQQQESQKQVEASLPHKIAIEIICCSNPNSVKKRFSLPEKHDGIINGISSFTPSVKGTHRRYTTSDLPTSPRDVSEETESSIRIGTSLGCVFFDVEQIWNSTGGRCSAALPGSGGTVVHVHMARDSILLPLPLTPTTAPTSTVTTTTSSFPLDENPILKSSPKLTLQIRGIKLQNTRNAYMLSRPNFYYEIHRKVRDVNGDTWALIYRSQRCMETLNPLWPEVTLGLYPCLNYYNVENCGKDMEKEMGERWSKVDVKITLIDSASSTSSLFHASSTSTGNSSSSSSSSGSKKKRASLINNAAVLGTVTTTLQSLLSLSCAKGCNMSLQKSLHITRNGRICGQLVIVSADIKLPQKNANAVDVMNEQMGKLSCSATASLPSAPVAPSMDHGSLFLNSSAPPLFATAIREGGDESASPHSSVSVSLHSPRITSFDEYIRNGSKLELCVAIDFTNNNGLDWNTPDNAHYHSSSFSSSDSNVGSEDDNVSMITTATGGGKRRMNNYEFILSTIGSVVSNLNNDGVGSIDADHYNNSEIDIPMWGFGAEFEGRQYNIFQCGNVTKAKKDQNGNNGSSRRNVIVNHLLNTYHDTFECFPTLGPTDTNGVVYDGVIRAAMSHANKRKKYVCKEHGGGGELSYTLLVILTTGSKDDVMRCKEHLVDAMMKSPLSVLFISVGKENGANNFQRLEPNGDFLLKEYMSRQQQQQQQQAGFGGGIGKRRSFLTFVEGTDWHVPHRDAKSLARVAFQHVSDQVVEYFSLN